MTFSDTLQIGAMTYGTGYAVFDNKAYLVEEGKITDNLLDIDISNVMFDENMNALEPYTEFFDFSKCFISFNSQASKVRLNDGHEYMYSYYVIAPLKKSLYHIIPREGQRVRIKKADGTIDKEMEVRGFVTYKQRYLKIWL